MFKSFIPEHLYKDWLLHFSGFLTWSIICFLSLNNLPVGAELFLKLTAFLSFYLSFAIIVSSKAADFPRRDKLILLCQVVVVLILIKFDKYDIAPILLVLIATQLPSRFSRRQAMYIMISITAAHFLLKFDGNMLNTLFHVIIYLMLQVFGFSAIESNLREVKAKEELSAINQELLATRFMLKESSQRKERLRISRDLHDVIGHQLTALALNLEVSRHKVPEEFKPLLGQNLAHAKTLLSDVREVVKEMRTEEQFDLVDKLSALIEQLPGCQLKVESAPKINALSLKQQLMFCLQEGVSNAIRHGKANTFTLSAIKTEQQLSLYLLDNGSVKSANVLSSMESDKEDNQLVNQPDNQLVNQPDNQRDKQSGSGLAGMQERLADFNGLVELIQTSTGCTLKIQVEDSYD
ncbi:sensor histidine kinase [Colwellia psychrerythraea]|uniref:Integral membrane sensor signal transduction histidine kinase n=1 Tax=Colwellia psychrerythraea TaxID=28229 RepID=A0A099L3J6_COLPS|nr:histidine kinase [Colwellia psychrerythraea]KGJ96443.1 integral membrane sensor signal transduction histidine kinase [Colwellia psychrerythraea]